MSTSQIWRRQAWRKIAAISLFAIAAAASGGLGYLVLRKPAMAEPRAVTVEITPARIERGRYIFRLADCGGCHSQRDFSRFGGPMVPEERGKGGAFPPEMGLPGIVIAPNITPDVETGIGGWTDGEKLRAIREGISRDGRALFPMMPYQQFAHMSDDDAYSLVAYLKTLKPVRNRLARTELNFPVSLLIKGVPKPAGIVPEPDHRNKAQHGQYLVTLAECVNCHTPQVRGKLVETKRFGGGREFKFGPAVVVSANITPDRDTGLGTWSEEQFLRKFYQYREYVEKGSPPASPQSFTLMPWLTLCELPPEDLRAIYWYLRTVQPVYNAVETHPDANIRAAVRVYDSGAPVARISDRSANSLNAAN